MAGDAADALEHAVGEDRVAVGGADVVVAEDGAERSGTLGNVVAGRDGDYFLALAFALALCGGRGVVSVSGDRPGCVVLGERAREPCGRMTVSFPSFSWAWCPLEVEAAGVFM